jgi:hypothetical protein
MMLRRSLGRRFARQVARDCFMTVCGVTPASTSSLVGHATSWTSCRRTILKSLAARLPSKRVDRQGEEVADATFGLDNARRARVGFKLASETQDLDVDASIEDVFMDPRIALPAGSTE